MYRKFPKTGPETAGRSSMIIKPANLSEIEMKNLFIRKITFNIDQEVWRTLFFSMFLPHGREGKKQMPK